MRRIRWTSTPITPELSPWPPKAATASRAEVAHLAVVALPDRSLDLAPQVVEVDALASLEAGLLEAALHRLRLDGAKEKAVEHQLEHPPVLL